MRRRQRKELTMLQIIFWWWCGGVGDKDDCLKKEPKPIGGMPSVGVFLRDPSLIYASFGENHGNLRAAKSTSATGV